MHLNVARSRFKTESSIHFSVEPEMPVTKTLGNETTKLDEFAELRSASIYFVMSVFLIATTPIPLGGLS